MAISIKPIKRQKVSFHIVGTTPMIQHKWAEKAIMQMREKHAGKKTRARDIRKPEEEFQNACYLTDSDEYGFPLMGFKTSLITAAHKDIGIEKTLVKKSIFIESDDSNLVGKMECSEPIMREDCVRVGAGSTDLRYRPEFREWAAQISFEIDGEMLTVEDLINLTNRAGFGVGLCEWRPEKGGEYGRFKVDTTQPITTEDLV